MQTNFTLQRVTINEHGLREDYAEAQLTQAIANGIRGLRRRVMHRLDVRHLRHLPPI